MFDSIFEVAAQVLDFFYGIVPNYAIAIMMMTVLVMLITTPLTLKGTRGMIKMQLLQPELKKIQDCLLYTSPSPRDLSTSRMPSSA